MWEWEVRANYGTGAECVYTAATREEGVRVLRDYRENDRDGWGHRLIRVRVAA